MPTVKAKDIRRGDLLRGEKVTDVRVVNGQIVVATKTLQPDDVFHPDAGVTVKRGSE